ncbi:MAG: 16S rRNA (uracil(1498)-N(3))-methyltransferase [Calditrichaeota bacterium]|nr:16S rRNA (uracil(1498)-N(3))-methyltransferase [Calditrichota bacterium]
MVKGWDRQLAFFYAPDLSLHSTHIQLSPEESHHASRVLRKRTDDHIGLINGNGLMARARIDRIDKKGVACIIETVSTVPPPEHRIHVGLGMIRPNRMDWAVEKLTELGVHTIQPLQTDFTTAPGLKRRHLERVAISAMKQSQQAYLPTIAEPRAFQDWILQVPLQAEHAAGYIAHWMPDAKRIPSPADSLREIYLAVGPEGGFSEREVQLAVEAGFRIVKLQEQILRSETAAVVAVSQIKFLFL